jgi:hypothetical protein
MVLTELLIDPYCLHILQEIVVSVATAKIMAQNDRLKT